MRRPLACGIAEHSRHPHLVVGRQVVVGAPDPEDLVAALRQLAKQPGSR